MDSLGINSALSQANALTSRAENERAVRSDRIRQITLQNMKDKTAATDKIASDRNSFLLQDGFHAGETLYKLANETPSLQKDYNLSEGVGDFLGRQVKRSLAADIGRGLDNLTGNAVSGAINSGGPSIFGGGAAPSRRRNIQPQGQAGGAPADAPEPTPFERLQASERPRMSAGEFNSIGQGAEPIPDRTARLNRIFIRESQAPPSQRQGLNTTSPARDSDSAIRTQTVTDVQETAAANARGLSDAPLGNQLSHDTTNFGREAAQQGATDVEETTTPTPAPTPTPTPSSSTPDVPDEEEDPLSGIKSAYKKGSALMNNPLARTGMKVVGNIQGGEDIYDLFENRNKFDDKGQAGAGWHEGAHILSSLGTVSDVAGIFLPGAEELGAALNMTGEVLDSVGDHIKDKANASTVFTNASNSLATASKPVAISEGLQTAGLIAGSATHMGTTGTGVATF